MENRRKSFNKRDFKGGNTRKDNRCFDSDYNAEKEDNGVVVGRNAVRELLKSERAVDKIYVKKGGSHEGSITVLIAEAVSKGIRKCSQRASASSSKH